MSLINQMLRDLDERHAQAPIPDSLAGKLRSPPAKPAPRRSASLLVIAGALAGGLLVGAGVMLWLRPAAEPAPPPAPLPAVSVPPPAPKAPPPPPAPVPVAAEPVAVPAPPVVIPPPRESKPPRAPRAEAAKPGRAAAGESALKLEVGLNSAKKPERSPELAPPAPAALLTAKPSAPPVVDNTPSRIDKNQRNASGNEAAEAEYRKAIALVKRGATTEAVAGFLVALRHDPRHVPARQALLSQMVEQRQLAEALTVADEGLALDPAQVGWAMLAARLHMERGDPTAASEVLARHAKHAEGHGDYAAFQALLHQRFKHYRDAAERYQAALAVRPEEGRWWYGLGIALEGDQRPVEALNAFRKARDAGNLPPELAASVEQRLR